MKGLAGFEPASSYLEWGICPSYLDSTWKNGPEDVPFQQLADGSLRNVRNYLYLSLKCCWCWVVFRRKEYSLWIGARIMIYILSYFTTSSTCTRLSSILNIFKKRRTSLGRRSIYKGSLRIKS
ncbi:hypothetical protein GcM1_223012 [Golovinomyces cichoracearum]|uniref:Uncharacterized protein n=1 Tax=Golovinomyces cichoracearum TaxID=62708 RepID=A0A420IQQ9_9PEZI|nr:hypothetical protein GcM1_223012 [Golovinomyces cichoracearum]